MRLDWSFRNLQFAQGRLMLPDTGFATSSNVKCFNRHPDTDDPVFQPGLYELALARLLGRQRCEVYARHGQSHVSPCRVTTAALYCGRQLMHKTETSNSYYDVVNGGHPLSTAWAYIADAFPTAFSMWQADLTTLPANLNDHVWRISLLGKRHISRTRAIAERTKPPPHESPRFYNAGWRLGMPLRASVSRRSTRQP